MIKKHLLFVNEYLKDLNGTQAALRAGYSVASAGTTAERLLKKAEIAAAVQNRSLKIVTKLEITQEKIIREIAMIAFSNMKTFARWGKSGVDFKEVDEISDADAACIKEISESTNEHGGQLSIKLHDKLKALTTLGKYMGMDTPDSRSLTLSMSTSQKLEVAKEMVSVLEAEENAKAIEVKDDQS